MNNSDLEKLRRTMAVEARHHFDTWRVPHTPWWELLEDYPNTLYKWWETGLERPQDAR